MNAPHLPGLAFPTTPKTTTTRRTRTKRPTRTFTVAPGLIFRQVVEGRAWSAHNADNPTSHILAVAMLDRTGWKVATPGGVVADQLTGPKAVALMKKVAVEEVDREALRQIMPAPTAATVVAGPDTGTFPF